MENKTNQKEEHISQIESKIGESPFSNYYSNSLGGENAKIKKSNDLEPLPNKDRLEIKNTGKNKRKDNQEKMVSFDFKSGVRSTSGLVGAGNAGVSLAY